MKRWNLFFLFAFLFVQLSAQKITGSFYIFKKDGSPAADVKKAAFLQHIFPVNDTTYIMRYYNFAGPMIVQQTYRDSNLTIPNGRFCWYNTNGKLDSTGIVSNGKKDGTWEFFISRNETRNATYDKGIRTKEQVFHYDNNGKYIPADTSHEDEEEDPTQKAAVYKKGVDDWISYIRENLVTPERLKNTLQEGVHNCMVNFLVNKEGGVEDIYISQSCEWSGDAEALRLIADSPEWQPAIQKGKPVFYRQRQPISYDVQSGNYFRR